MTIGQAIHLNMQSGCHFFDAGAMEFFGSKVETGLLPDDMFITSEYTGFEKKARAYTVRQFTDDYSDVRDVSKFCAFDTLEEARDFALSSEV